MDEAEYERLSHDAQIENLQEGEITAEVIESLRMEVRRLHEDNERLRRCARNLLDACQGPDWDYHLARGDAEAMAVIEDMQSALKGDT